MRRQHPHAGQRRRDHPSRDGLLIASAIAAGALAPRRAQAHEGEPLAPHDLLAAWVLEPGIVLPLLLSAVLYFAGLRALWRTERGRGIRRWEAGAFLAGWLALVLALISPLHPLGEVLFSAHMTQHVLIMGIAAPLMVLGRPMIPFLWALPMSWRRSAGAWAKVGPVRALWGELTRPFTAFALQAVAIVLWHVPVLYDATVVSDWVHTLQHATFLATALLFWWALIHGRERRLGHGVAVLYLFLTLMISGGLGALLTVAPRPWYTAYADVTSAWGLTTLEDQQLAGLIMWIPAGLPYLIAALLLLFAWLRESERRAARWEAPGALDGRGYRDPSPRSG